MKKVGIIKRMFCLCLIFLLSINSFAAIVSDNDGSAFITKAEFDALKSAFQSQIDSYNQSIDSKIDGAIASYLSGISLSSEIEVNSNFLDYYQLPATFWRTDTSNQLAVNNIVSGQLTNSIPVEIIAFEVYSQTNGSTDAVQTGAMGTLQFFGKSYDHNITLGWDGTYNSAEKIWYVKSEAKNWNCSYRLGMTYETTMGFQGAGPWRFNTWFGSSNNITFDMNTSQNITTGIFVRQKQWANYAKDASKYNSMSNATWPSRTSYGGYWGESASSTYPAIASYQETAEWKNKFGNFFTNNNLRIIRRNEKQQGIYDVYCGGEHQNTMTIWNSAQRGNAAGGRSDHTFDVTYLKCWPPILKPRYTDDSANTSMLSPKKSKYTVTLPHGATQSLDFCSSPILWVAQKNTPKFKFDFSIDSSSTCSSATIDFGKTFWNGDNVQDCTEPYSWGLNSTTLTTGAKTITKGNTYTVTIGPAEQDDILYFRIVPDTGNCILKSISNITYTVEN